MELEKRIDENRMMSAVLRDEVRAFMEERLASMDDVDTVVFLMRHPTRAWTAQEVASAITASPETTAARLYLLSSAGVVSCDAHTAPRYRYVVSDDEQDSLLRELADACATDRHSVAGAIGTPAPASWLRRLLMRFERKK
jgi:hypothetical protein